MVGAVFFLVHNLSSGREQWAWTMLTSAGVHSSLSVELYFLECSIPWSISHTCARGRVSCQKCRKFEKSAADCHVLEWAKRTNSVFPLELECCLFLSPSGCWRRHQLTPLSNLQYWQQGPRAKFLWFTQKPTGGNSDVEERIGGLHFLRKSPKRVCRFWTWQGITKHIARSRSKRSSCDTWYVHVSCSCS